MLNDHRGVQVFMDDSSKSQGYLFHFSKSNEATFCVKRAAISTPSALSR